MKNFPKTSLKRKKLRHDAIIMNPKNTTYINNKDKETKQENTVLQGLGWLFGTVRKLRISEVCNARGILYGPSTLLASKHLLA